MLHGGVGVSELEVNCTVVGFLGEVILIILRRCSVILVLDRGLRFDQKIMQGYFGRVGRDVRPVHADCLRGKACGSGRH